MNRRNRTVTEPFQEYRGTAYLDKVDPDQRTALYAWQEVLRLGQGTLVDGEYFINSQIYLCKETAGYIYSKYSPTEVNYQPGSRPFLEKVVKGLGIMGRSGFDKFLWLARFVRDLPDARGWDLGKEGQDGGTEEELIQKRVLVCNEQARLLVTLCQVAGLPARYIGHHIGGHGVTEVYVDGHWGYHDIRGKFFLKKNGQMASTWEIWQNPKIIRQQPEWVTREVHPRYWYQGDPYAATEMTYFHPKECTGVVNYFIADHHKFDYARDWPMTKAARDISRELVKQRNAVRRKFRMFHTEAFTASELRKIFGVFRNGRWTGAGTRGRAKWILNEGDSPCTTLLRFAMELGCRPTPTGKGKTTRIRFGVHDFGYVNSTVIQRRACYGYKFRFETPNDGIPTGKDRAYRQQFRKRYGDLPGQDWHSGKGSNSHRTFLCITNIESAKSILRKDVEEPPYRHL